MGQRERERERERQDRLADTHRGRGSGAVNMGVCVWCVERRRWWGGGEVHVGDFLLDVVPVSVCVCSRPPSPSG